MLTWIQALEVWNNNKGGVWCVPRKGSKAYDDVIAIMRRGGGDKSDALKNALQELKDAIPEIKEVKREIKTKTKEELREKYQQYSKKIDRITKKIVDAYDALEQDMPERMKTKSLARARQLRKRLDKVENLYLASLE